MSTSSDAGPISEKGDYVAYLTISEPSFRKQQISSVVRGRRMVRSSSLPAFHARLREEIRNSLSRPGMIADIDFISINRVVLWMSAWTDSISANHSANSIVQGLQRAFQAEGKDFLFENDGLRIIRSGPVENRDNQPTVVVVMVPTTKGLLMIRRGLKDGFGKLALPGGYQVIGETSQEAGAREVLEETGLRIDASKLQIVATETVGENKDTILLFFRYPETVSVLNFHFDEEVLEVVTITQPVETAFPTHTAQVKAFFDHS